MNWYYDLGGTRQGPVPDAELDRLLAAGTITTNTLVWREGMTDWALLSQARPAAGGTAPAVPAVPEGWIRCTATGRHFPPSQIVYLDGKPYSAEAKPGIVQGVMQTGVLPADAGQERTGPAWEQRAQVGFLPAIWQTMKGVLLDPNGTFASMKREGGFGAPLGYHVLLGSIGSMASLFYQVVLQFGGLSSLPPELKDKFLSASGSPGLGIAAFMIGAFIAIPLFMVISTFLYSGLFHLSLMICSGAKQPYETTLRTYCYATGSGALFQLIPIMGASIGGLWGLVCLCMGLAKTHEIGTGRAVCAVLLPMAFCCAVAVVAVVAAIGLVAGAAGMSR